MKVQEMFNLKDKVAIVSGGGRGIGLKMAEGLAEAGAHLVICSRKVERCVQAAQELAEQNKIRALALKCALRQGYSGSGGEDSSRIRQNRYFSK